MREAAAAKTRPVSPWNASAFHAIRLDTRFRQTLWLDVSEPQPAPVPDVTDVPIP